MLENCKFGLFLAVKKIFDTSQIKNGDKESKIKLVKVVNLKWAK